MKCPHCRVDLKYRERRDRRCPHCKKQFALEPRNNALKMNDLRLLGLAERLSRRGTYRYTTTQLRYFTVLRYLQPLVKEIESRDLSSSRHNVLIIVAVLIAVLLVFQLVALLAPNLGSVLGCLSTPLVILVIIVGFLIIGISNSHIRPQREIEKLLDLASKQAHSFEQTYILPWERIHGQLPGRVSQEELARLRQYQPPPSRLRAALVSPDMDVLDCLRANGVPSAWIWRCCLSRNRIARPSGR